MQVEQKVDLVFNFVRQHGKIVPRDYQTIGGMWTVDTWTHEELPGVRVQLMDEGYTHAVYTEDLYVVSTHGRPVNFARGGAEHLELLVERVNNVSNG